MNDPLPDWRTLVAGLRIAPSGQRPLSRDEEAAWEDLRQRVWRLAQISIRWYQGLTLDDVDDIGLDLMAKLLEPAVLQSLKASASPAGYIVRALKNRAASLSAARRTRADLSPELAYEARDWRDETEIGEPLARLLRDLPPDDLAMIRDRFWGDLSIGEMALQRGITYSAMAVRLFRLIVRLRRELTDDPRR
jgi:DNA-directed RNA polymerase specialized sigma24 family protein